ncbi:alpha-amylase domain-containing protein [Natronoarchaeum sp. GCM10025703]|uniref:alpha-amylase domain-containing protein n=1 Tax=Natronoarchaeum sp. GCM10025703 TaxID=3252685 RepID=UPI003621B783
MDGGRSQHGQRRRRRVRRDSRPRPAGKYPDQGRSGGSHPEYGDEYPYHPPLGYQPYDRTSLDSEFGTEAEFRSMIDEAHAQGVDVIVDVVLNHNGYGPELDDFPNLDSQHFYQEGGIEGWMYSYDPNDDRCYDPNGWECAPDEIETNDLVGLPSLDWTTQTVQDLAYNYLQLLADCGADGVRWDAAKHVHNWVFAELLNPWADELGFYTVGEVLHDPIGYVDEYAQTGMDVTDYPLFYTMKYEAFSTDGDFRALDGADAGYAAQNPFQSLTLIANHDSAPPELERLARAFILTYEGYPRLYSYLIDFDDPELRNLLWIRNNLLGGTAITRYVDQEFIVFERKDNAVVALNRGFSERSEWVDVPWTSEALQEYTGAAGDTEANSDGWAEITAPAGQWTVYAPQDAAEAPATDQITLQVEAPTADGESVYFTGGSDQLTGWGTGVEGTSVGSGVWEVSIDDPGTFGWKTRRGPEGGSGDVWEAGDNHTEADLAPAHQGWEDGFDGSSSTELEGTYSLRASHSGKALDVEGASTADGANVHQWGYLGKDNQHWTVEALGGDEYRLIAQHSGNVLAADGTGDGANVQQEAWADTASQRWTLGDVGDGSYVVENVGSGKTLDVEEASTDDGANVHQWGYLGKGNQHWTLDPV